MLSWSKNASCDMHNTCQFPNVFNMIEPILAHMCTQNYEFIISSVSIQCDWTLECRLVCEHSSR